MSVINGLNGHKSSLVQHPFGPPPKPAKWLRRPKGQPKDGVPWAEIEIWDRDRFRSIAYEITVNGEGEEIILSPTDSESTAGRVTLGSGGAECSCGEGDRKGGCCHQAGLKYLFARGF